MKHFLCGLIFSVLLAFFASNVFAATSKPFKTNDIGLAQLFSVWTSYTGPAPAPPVNVPVTIETVATTPANQQVTRYTTRPVPLTVARAAGMARNAVAVAGGPVGFTVSAALLAGSFLIEDGEIIQVDEPVGDTGDWWLSQSIFGGAQRYIPFYSKDAIESGIADYMDDIGFCYQSHTVTSNTSTSYVINLTTYRFNAGCTGLYQTGTLAFNKQTNVQCPSGFAAYSDGSCHPTSNPPSVPVTDKQIVDTLINDNPRNITRLLDDSIQKGTWPDDWPELLPYVNDISSQLGHDIEGGPEPVNPDETITDSSTFNPPDNSSDSISAEWPAFCSWAGVVCDFIDWVQEPFEEPAPVEIPYVEVDFEEDYDSGIGIPNCPAPISIVTQFGEVHFDWSNTCSLAEMIKPLVIAFSYLIGIYILLRVK